VDPSLDSRLLDAQVAAWIAGDPDADDRAELLRLRNTGDEASLRKRFAGPPQFGTAGLRGPLHAGESGMNTAVVRRAAAGIARWLLDRRPDSPDTLNTLNADPPLSVVVGFDARHCSAAFALDIVRVLAATGIRAMLLPRALPTPVLAFAVRHLDAAAGIMVTASHNPATDNGLKVYLGGPAGDPGRGAQLVSPADTEIEAAITAVGRAVDVPLADGWHQLDDSVAAAYVKAAATSVPPLGPIAPATVAYTPLHGVGAEVLAAVFAAAGFDPPTTVADQVAPDPDFPTVPFPNPEEAGAMDHVLALGERVGADLVVATDPDADRCAVAVRGRVLTGDEVGLLLADDVVSRSPGPVATTVVSSTALRRLAAASGVGYTETLTGFKWIMRSDPELVFGYEEALGYAVAPTLVRDKDGVTAALALARLASLDKRAGRTLLDRLDDLARRFGVHATTQVSLRVDDPREIDALMRRLRTVPPRVIAGCAVVGVRDLLTPRHGTPDLPAADVLIFNLAHDSRVVVRPSGTEPKLKAYLEVVVPVGGGGDAAAAARTRATGLLAELRSAVIDLLQTSEATN
jgi:phosphomannomutase